MGHMYNLTTTCTSGQAIVVNGNKLTVDAATGNTVVAGTLTAGGAAVVLTAGDQTIGGAKTFTGALRNSAGAGTAGTGATAAEYGDGVLHRTVLTLDLTGANGYTLADGNDDAGKSVYAFPAGRILVLGAVADLTCTTSAGMTGNYYAGAGTAEAVDNNGDLAAAEQDIVNKITVTNGADQAGHGQDGGAALYVDGTAGAGALWLNLAAPDASVDTGGATVAVTGTLAVTWITLGDY